MNMKNKSKEKFEFPKTKKLSAHVTKESEEMSSIDPSLLKDLMKSEESNVSKQNQIKNTLTDGEDIEIHSINENELEEHEEVHEEYLNEEYNPRFTGEVINIDDDEEEEDNKNLSNEIKNKDEIGGGENLKDINLKNKRSDLYHPHGMERISEAENEDDKHNTIFDKINSEMLKEDFRLNDHNFDEIMRHEINSSNVKDFFNTALYNSEGDGSNKFKPKINKKSQLIAHEKKDQSDKTDKTNKSSNSITEFSRSKTPIELELYKDAVKRKEKLQKIEYNHMMAIILNASKTKISNNSHRISIMKIEKITEVVVSKHKKDKKLSFINIGEVLTELKIFREIFADKEKSRDDKDNKKKYQSYKEIKLELNSVKEIEKRKKAEVDFFEQLWITLNPDNKDYIKSDILTEFLKILFSPVASSVKEISSILRQFLLAAFFLNTNPEEQKNYISPITEKKLSEEEIWPLDKLVKEFILLKENILAYQNIHNKKLAEEEVKQRELEKEKENRAKYKSRCNFWEERLHSLLDREKLRSQVLEEMKKENDQNLLKECTFKPHINKKTAATHAHEDQNNSNYSAQPVFDKLYSTHKDSQLKRQKDSEENKIVQANKELIGCTFQPKFVSNKSYEKSINSQEKPKGFAQTVDRLRRGIIETMKKKYLIKKIPTGENYEKIKRANIKPFNITDMKKRDELDEKEENKDDSDDYFSIQVTIPTGKERTLRVHKDDDPYEIADNFCKVYGMKDEIKQRLAKTIMQFMNLYLIKDEKSQFNEPTITNNQINNFSQNNLNLDEL